jgi:hypothetical protein
VLIEDVDAKVDKVVEGFTTFGRRLDEIAGLV